jgi:hypothetical protein
VIGGNEFNGMIMSSSGGVYGIYIEGAVCGAIGCGEGASDTASCKNSFSATTAMTADAYGIFANGGLEGGVIGGNVFNGAITAGVAYGIYADAVLEGGVIGGNVFNDAITAGSNAYGISVGGTVSGTIGCGEDASDTASCKNSFSAITGMGGDADGIFAGAFGLSIIGTFGGANASIRHNTFNVTSRGKIAVGVYFFNSGLTDGSAAKITNNALRVSAGIDNAGAFGFGLVNNTGLGKLMEKDNNNEFARGDGALIVITGFNTPPGATCIADGCFE